MLLTFHMNFHYMNQLHSLNRKILFVFLILQTRYTHKSSCHVMFPPVKESNPGVQSLAKEHFGTKSEKIRD